MLSDMVSVWLILALCETFQLHCVMYITIWVMVHNIVVCFIALWVMFHNALGDN